MYLYPCLFSVILQACEYVRNFYDIKMIRYKCRYINGTFIKRQYLSMHVSSFGFVLRPPKIVRLPYQALFVTTKQSTLLLLRFWIWSLLARIFFLSFFVNVANDHNLTGFISKPSWFYFQGTLYYIIPFFIFTFQYQIWHLWSLWK